MAALLLPLENLGPVTTMMWLVSWKGAQWKDVHMRVDQTPASQKRKKGEQVKLRENLAFWWLEFLTANSMEKWSLERKFGEIKYRGLQEYKLLSPSANQQGTLVLLCKFQLFSWAVKHAKLGECGPAQVTVASMQLIRRTFGSNMAHSTWLRALDEVCLTHVDGAQFSGLLP